MSDATPRPAAPTAPTVHPLTTLLGLDWRTLRDVETGEILWLHRWANTQFCLPPEETGSQRDWEIVAEVLRSEVNRAHKIARWLAAKDAA